MPVERDLAVCVRQWDWSETSQTVALLTERHGVVRALAKGSRRPKSPFSGGVELLTRGEIGLILKPGKDLALLTEWDLAEHFPTLRRSLAVYHAGLYGAEVVLRLIGDHDPHPEVYGGLLGLLRRMEAEGEPGVGAGLLDFQRGLLRACGFAPVLDRDVRTGGPLGGGGVAQFVPELGGVVPEGVEVSTGGMEGRGRVAEAWKVRRSTLEVLSGRVGSPAEVERANRLLGAYIRTLIGSTPRTLGLVMGEMG